MITGKTKSGFKFSFDERILTDWRLTLALVKTQKGSDQDKLKGASELVTLILGEEGTDKLIEHLMKKNDGFAPTDKLMLEITDIMTSSKELKN